MDLLLFLLFFFLWLDDDELDRDDFCSFLLRRASRRFCRACSLFFWPRRLERPRFRRTEEALLFRIASAMRRVLSARLIVLYARRSTCASAGILPPGGVGDRGESVVNQKGVLVDLSGGSRSHTPRHYFPNQGVSS